MTPDARTFHKKVKDHHILGCCFTYVIATLPHNTRCQQTRRHLNATLMPP